MKPKEEETCLDTKEKVQGGDSDQEMMNLENELYSLTHYADDEEELVAQMFATIKGSKLEAMMPPILKEIPLIDVQQLCLHELRGMSQRRILSIINGQEMSGSSSEDSESEKKTNDMNENEDSNTATKSVEGENEDLLTGKDLSELENMNESNLTTLDILELEMRAKLIKTMLEKQDGDEGKEEGGGGEEGATGFVPDIKIKEEPLTPENTHVEDNVSEGRSPDSTHKNRYSRKKRRHRRRSNSRSSSRSSYTSRSRSRSRSSTRSSSRSPSYSRSISYTPEGRKEGSDSPKLKKALKKKISKKEFEERMKKAKMNRSYRKRKESEEETGETVQVKKEPNENEEPSENPPGQMEVNNAETTEDVNAERAAEVGEEGQAEEGEIEEKEEGEIDSNEEVWSRSSRSYSRSYSSDSYSSCSSRSRSYSRSPKRRKSKKSKKRRRRRRSRSRSSSDVPKIPNWKPNEATVINIDKSVSTIADTKISASPKPEKTLPDKEERQSISFLIGKKSNAAVKTSELNVDTNTSTSVPEDNEQDAKVEDGESKETGDSKENEDSKKTAGVTVESEKSLKIESKNSKPQGGAEVTENFCTGVDQLSISEGECEDDKVSEKNLSNDIATDTIENGDSSSNVSESIKSGSIQNVSMKKKKKLFIDEAIRSIELVEIDSVLEESNDIPKDVEEVAEVSQLSSLPDVGQDSTQDVLEPLPETEAEDSRESHSLDIIGVIDPAEKPDDTFDELSAGGSSWSMRWLQSEKVQKVVSNSKMLSKVRKKIQAKGKGIIRDVPKPIPKQIVVETKPESESPKIEIKLQPPKPASNVIGSIEEYEKLVGIKVKAPTSLPHPKPQAKPAPVSQVASLLDSDDEEDSEEEAIWSKIMKK